MDLFRWLKCRSDLAPVNTVSEVRCLDSIVELKRPLCSSEVFSVDQLRRVVIQTTDTGPLVDDVFFILETDAERYVIPQEAVGSAELLEWLQGLPRFNNDAVMEAMSCCENSEFLCWEKP